MLARNFKREFWCKLWGALKQTPSPKAKTELVLNSVKSRECCSRWMGLRPRGGEIGERGNLER